VAQLAERCLPALAAKGVGKLDSLGKVETRRIAGVWTGEGGVVEVAVTGAESQACTFVAKFIGSYKNVRNESGLVDHMSYYNEMCFYETELPDRMCAAGATCPRALLVDRRPSGAEDRSVRVAGPQTASRLRSALRAFRVRPDDAPEAEEKDEGVICMTKLPGAGWRPSADRTEAALRWLARLHALFWGARADEAVAAGAAGQAGFWHLDTRHLELASMPAASPLRLAAAGIDARLKADSMQTICHGDPKGANIMWDEATGEVSMYDFQWLGKSPPTRDLAYFFATAALNSRDFSAAKEERLLRYYHGQLCALLGERGEEGPSFERLRASYTLAVSDYNRWVEGGFCWGNMDLIEAQSDILFAKLHEGGAPQTEEEYQKRIFERFPP